MYLSVGLILHVVRVKAFKIGKLTANTIRKRQYYSEVVQFVGNGGRYGSANPIT